MKNKYEVPTLRDLIDSAPEKFGDRTFIKYRRGEEIAEVPYSRLRDDTHAFCRMVRAEYPEGAHFAVFSSGSYEYIVALCGIMTGGGVIIPASPDMSAADAASLCDSLDADVILYSEEFADALGEVRRLCPRILAEINIGAPQTLAEIRETYSASSRYAALSDYAVDPDACSLIIRTSGTTGDSKGVMLSTRALVGNVFFTPYSETITGAYTNLSVLPLYHILCFVADFIGPLKLGCTICLNGPMKDLFGNLPVFKPESMRIVPMIAGAILARINAVAAKHPELTRKEAAALVTGGRLRVLMSGGAYLDPALCRAFDELGIFLRQGYGMSEAGCKVTVPDEDCDVESVGRVMDILRVRIEGGEVQIDTPCRMIGYYKDEAATAAAFTPDGWLRTGDMGVLKDDGQLFITGRLKNLIILSNGENVSPEMIENRYRVSPLVSEVLVCAENDMITAHIFPNAEYAAKNGVTDVRAALEALTDEINLTALPSHTVARVAVRETPFEKTATGKIKRALPGAGGNP